MKNGRREPLNLSWEPLEAPAAEPVADAPALIDSTLFAEAFNLDAPSQAADADPAPGAASAASPPEAVAEPDLLGPPPLPAGLTAFEPAPDRSRKRRRAEREQAALAARAASEASPAKPANAPRAPKPLRAQPAAKAGIPSLGRLAYAVSIGGGVMWAVAFVAFVIGFGKLGPFDYGPFRDVVVAALAVAPALFMLLFAYALRQGARLGEDVRTARKLSEDLVGPAALAAARTGDLMQTMRGEIEQAAEAAEAAERRLTVLREGLADESRRLADAAREAQDGARLLGESLGRERGELEHLSQALQVRTAEITEAVGRQSRLATDVSDLAQAQLAEAQAALAARAADLAAAAADVREETDAAAEMLSRQTERMDQVGVGLAGRLSTLGDQLTRERDHLARLAEGLKGESEAVFAETQARQQRLVETAGAARQDSDAAAAAAGHAADSLRRLIGETADQMRAAAAQAAEARAAAAVDAQAQLDRLAAEAARQRSQALAQAQMGLDALSGAAEQAQSAAAVRLGELQGQADSLGAAALERIEQLGEAAFAAGQRADQAFDARISAAKRAIDQSAQAVEEAGLRSAQRIEAGLSGVRGALGELEVLLADVDGRVSTLPEEAKQRAELVRSAVERGVGDLTAAARRAAEETQAIDAAFQERVRKNYDTLSEAVRLMGRVAGAVDAAARPAEPAAAPRATPAQVHALDLAPRRAPEPAAEAEAAPIPLAVGDSHPRFTPAATTSTSPAAAAAAAEPPAMFLRGPAPAAGWREASAADLFTASAAPPPSAPSAPSAAGAGLRPRLKLTAAPEAEPIRAPIRDVPAAGGRPAAGEPGWSWKDLLSTLPAEAPAAAQEEDDEAVADKLIAEIEALGLDLAALLPRAQVEDIAHALQSGRGGGAREGVRRLAPAAVRRLSRRVLTDAVLRHEADRFVRRYAGLVNDAVRRDGDGFLVSALLGSDAGRAFLMLDAAVGDLAH